MQINAHDCLLELATTCFEKLATSFVTQHEKIAKALCAHKT